MTIKEKIKIRKEIRNISGYPQLRDIITAGLLSIANDYTDFYYCGAVTREYKARSVERSLYVIECAEKKLRKEAKRKARDLRRHWIIPVWE